MFPGTTVTLHEGAHMGHGAIVHRGIIGANSLIGIITVIMDDAVIGEECIIGALSFVPAKMNISKRSLVVGNPALVVKEVSQEMIDWKTKGTALYQALPGEGYAILELYEAFTADGGKIVSSVRMCSTWKKIKSK